MKKINNIFSHPLVLMMIGVILGIFSKYGDIAYTKTFLSYFGLLSSGIVIWLILCTMILIFASKKKQAIISLALLMLSMFISYYIFSYFVVKYISIKVIVFWIIMLSISLLIAHCVWNIRFTKKFRILFFIAAIFLIIYDAFNINGFDLIIMITEIISTIITLHFLNKMINKNGCKNK